MACEYQKFIGVQQTLYMELPDIHYDIKLESILLMSSIDCEGCLVAKFWIGYEDECCRDH